MFLICLQLLTSGGSFIQPNKMASLRMRKPPDEKEAGNEETPHDPGM